MKELSDSFDLISQMVNETFNNVQDFTDTSEEVVKTERKVQKLEIDKPSVQLEFHFDSYLGAYDALRSCYVFQVEDQVIECPVNWGPFRFASYTEGEVEELFSLTKEEDLDLFFEIIETISSKHLKSLKCLNVGNHLRLVFELETHVENTNVIEFPKTNLALVA
jgi:hypothetical protein